MYKLLLLLVIVCSSNFVIAQQNTGQTLWRLTIVDANTARAIRGVTVSINNERNYTTSDNGSTIINKTFISLGDSVIISCMGYKSQLLLLSGNSQYPDTIKLLNSFISLKEVTINPAKLTDIRVGDIKKRYNVHGISSPHSAYVQFIPNDGKIRGIITSVAYTLNDELHGIENPFRVRLYTKNKSSITLDQELTKDSIIVNNPLKRHRVIVELSQYNIQMPVDGVLVVFETLPASCYGTDSTFYHGRYYAKTPGIDMDLTKNKWEADTDKNDRKGPYSMVGPDADRWNWNDEYTQWFVYADGNNFAITITIGQN